MRSLLWPPVLVSLIFLLSSELATSPATAGQFPSNAQSNPAHGIAGKLAAGVPAPSAPSISPPLPAHPITKPSKQGNFNDFRAEVEKLGFQAKPPMNGFYTFIKPQEHSAFFMRNCDGYSCEGMVIAPLTADTQLDAYITLLYSSVENTLALVGRPAVAPNQYKERVALLRQQLKANLTSATRTEFTFDHLKVRGMSISGSIPSLLVKIWVP